MRRSVSAISLSLALAACGYRVYEPPAVPIAGTTSPAAASLRGKVIPIVLSTPIGSEDGSAARASFVVAQDVRGAYGDVVLPAGTPVLATVRVRGRRRLGRPAVMSINLVAAVAPDGSSIPLSGHLEVRGKARGGRVAGFMIGMMFVYPPLNFLHLLHRGGRVNVPAGTFVPATVANDHGSVASAPSSAALAPPSTPARVVGPDASEAASRRDPRFPELGSTMRETEDLCVAQRGWFASGDDRAQCLVEGLVIFTVVFSGPMARRVEVVFDGREPTEVRDRFAGEAGTWQQTTIDQEGYRAWTWFDATRSIEVRHCARGTEVVFMLREAPQSDPATSGTP